MSDKRLTPEELSKYDGSGESGEIYVAIRGVIYDVTSKKDMYGPGGNYRVFAGKDASKALAKSSLKLEDCVPDVSELNEEENALFLQMDVAQALTISPLRDVEPMETGVPTAPATAVSAPEAVLGPLSEVDTRTLTDLVPDVVMSSPQAMHGAHSSQNSEDRAHGETPSTADSTGHTTVASASVTAGTDMQQLASSSHVTAIGSAQKHVNTTDSKDKQVECGRKERVIAYVLQQGKVIKMSRRLRTRLEYAVLKIRRGWSKYTLQEVESLLEAPTTLPLLTSERHPNHKRARSMLTPTTSLRQSERKRTRKAYPDYEQHSELVSRNGGRKHRANSPSIIPSSAPGIAGGYLRRTRPSFSLFKDSELFLPAKSLMDIATSSPAMSPATSPRPQHSSVSGSGSKYGYRFTAEPLYRNNTPAHNNSNHWHGSLSAAPVGTTHPTMRDIIELQSKGDLPNNEDGGVEDERDEETIEAPPDAQAARTILMLASSPTRPPPRTLNIQSTASTPPSPVLQPIEAAPLFSSPAPRPATTTGTVVASSAVGGGGGSGTRLLPASYSPMTKSQTTAASTPSPDRSPSLVNSTVSIERDTESTSMDHGDDNPFLSRKKTVTASPSSAISALLHVNNSSRHEPTSRSPLSVSSSAEEPMSDLWDPTQVDIMGLRDNDMLGPLDSPFDMAPIHGDGLVSANAVSSTPSPPLASFRAQQGSQALGIQTPPPSGGIGIGVSGKSIMQESIMARRRGSGLAGGGPGIDLVSVYFPNADSSGLHVDPSSSPGARDGDTGA
ncbi:hypothetical protein BGX34_000670 [Mortierella sp. NVP85]|nr:hypothetical protein BGX34_000670 [Mortierella sp. NVP85]